MNKMMEAVQSLLAAVTEQTAMNSGDSLELRDMLEKATLAVRGNLAKLGLPDDERSTHLRVCEVAAAQVLEDMIASGKAATVLRDAEITEDDALEEDEEDEDIPEPATVLLQATVDNRLVEGADLQDLIARTDQFRDVQADGAHSAVGKMTLLPQDVAADIPSGTVVFHGKVALPDGRCAVVEATIPGAPAQENPPLVPQQVLEQHRAEVQERGGDLPVVRTIRLHLSRPDGNPLLESHLEAPLNMAIGTLQDYLGMLVAGNPEACGDGSFVVPLEVVAQGQMEATVFPANVATFTGVLAFPGIGKVRAQVLA